jgi:hypothetical protein
MRRKGIDMTSSNSSRVMRALAEAIAFQPTQQTRVVAASCLPEGNTHLTNDSLDIAASSVNPNAQS